VEAQLLAVGRHWAEACEEAELPAADRTLLWGRQFLNPFAFEDLEGDAPACGSWRRKFAPTL